MIWPKNLTTFDGGFPGMSTLRSMMAEAGGIDGIRRVDRIGPDGVMYTLNTRAGMPEVVTTPPLKRKNIFAREFSARMPGRPTGVRFSPYSLEVHDPAYPLVGQQFTLAAFDSSADPLDWFDVWCNLGGQAYINAAFTQAVLSKASGSPIFVGGPGDYPPTGFWALDGISIKHTNGAEAILLPASVRGEERATTGGPWLEDAVGGTRAGFAQIWYMGYAWNDPAGSWGYSCSTYPIAASSAGAETRYGVASNIPPPSFTNVHYENRDTTTEIPIGQVVNYYDCSFELEQGAGGPSRELLATWANPVYGAAVNRQTKRAAGNEWTAVKSDSLNILPGTSLDVSISNVFTLEDSVLYGHAFRYVHVPAFSYQQANITTSGDTFTTTGGFSITYDTMQVGDKGEQWIECAPSTSVGSQKRASQDLSYTVKLGNETLLTLEGTYGWDQGTPTGFSPIWALQAIGTLAYDSIVHRLLMGVSATTYNTNIPWYDLAVTTQNGYILAGFDAARAALRASSKTLIGDYHGLVLFQPATLASTYSQHATQSWNTKDYFLYDKDESVFGWVEGASSYAGTTQTITIAAVISVRGAEVRKPLQTYSFGVFGPGHIFSLIKADEEKIGSECIPTPNLNLMFMPAVRKQGMFPGMAYTTKAEEAAGIHPASLFNFRLALNDYSAVGGPQKPVIESNLLSYTPYLLCEMLYGYVFSHWGGNSPSQRYPVTNTAAYDRVANTIFSTEYQIHIRDGVDVDWVPSVAGMETDSNTVEVYRT